MASPTIFTEALVDYICNPDKFNICRDISEMPDNQVKPEDQPLWWGILGILVSVASGAIAGGNGFNFHWHFASLGWQLMNIFGSALWGPSILLWIIRLFVSDNENINWLFVLLSNVTLIGPILGYWLAVILVPIGWASDSDYYSTEALIRWLCWIVVAFFASFYQVAWIDDVRAVYTGD